MKIDPLEYEDKVQGMEYLFILKLNQEFNLKQAIFKFIFP